jgi:hypothetical protein
LAPAPPCDWAVGSSPERQLVTPDGEVDDILDRWFDEMLAHGSHGFLAARLPP